MLNKEKHRLIMGRVLKDIYTDTSIGPLLGFKGGTCAHFLYELPRFSVDLDFDLLQNDKQTQEKIFERVGLILKNYGEIKDKYIKRYTVFMLLSYGETDRNIKVEINTRKFLPDVKSRYELKEYLGISMLTARKDYLFAGKLAAFTLRGQVAIRDIYDICYFARNNWGIDDEIIRIWTGKGTKEHLADCIATIEKVKGSQVLQGLGELLTEKEKHWVKQHLKEETIFMLKNYISALSV